MTLHGLTLIVDNGGRELIRWQPQAPDAVPTQVRGAMEPPQPATLALWSSYLTGMHLMQYRHATGAAEPYWEEALRRDPEHSGSSTALAARAYAQADFGAAPAPRNPSSDVAKPEPA